MKFHSLSLPPSPLPPFETLESTLIYESFSKNRKLAVLHVPTSADGFIPLVRTTTRYSIPSQMLGGKVEVIWQFVERNVKEFLQRHFEGDQEPFMDGHFFNNATVEIYDCKYTTMKYHTDMALDLKPESWIALYSCYEDDSEQHLRTLKIKNKETLEEQEITLHNNSIVLFSTETNKKHLHQIMSKHKLLGSKQWIGVTMRTAKTLKSTESDKTYISTQETPNHKAQLRLADEDEVKTFCLYKGKENATQDFVYPEIDFTVSGSDLM